MEIDTSEYRQSVIVDCDNTMGLPFQEVDDGLALLYLLGQPDIQLLGVTTTFGNGSREQAYRQTQTLFQNYHAKGIPVLRGASAQGDTVTPAACFLAETTAAHPGKISLAAIGPLTNLLGAYQLDANFFKNLRQVVCMGGYLNPLRLGWRKVDELNFSADALAAWTLLQSGCPLTIMSAQTCLQATFGWSDLLCATSFDSMTRSAVRKWLLASALNCGIAHFYLWDLLPAVYLNFPDLFTSRPVDVISSVTDLTSGTLVIEEKSDSRLINLPQRIKDIQRFQQVVFEAWRTTYHEHYGK